MLCALIRWKLWAAADAPYACPQCPGWVSKVCGLRLAAHAPKELEDRELQGFFSILFLLPTL